MGLTAGSSEKLDTPKNVCVSTMLIRRAPGIVQLLPGFAAGRFGVAMTLWSVHCADPYR